MPLFCTIAVCQWYLGARFGQCLTYARFGSKAEKRYAVQKGMSALPPKADMCSAIVHVYFGPIADSCNAAKQHSIQTPRRRLRVALANLDAKCSRDLKVDRNSNCSMISN